MKFAVTGSNGFVGPHLINLLIKEGHEVIAFHHSTDDNVFRKIIDNEKVYPSRLEIHPIFPRISEKIYEAFQKYFIPDGIFHLASITNIPYSFKFPSDYFYINALGSINLIETLSNNYPNVNFMLCSTSEVYGDSFNILTESSILSPINPYGVSKAAADLYCQERINSGKLKGYITRAFAHTGPRRGEKFSIASDAVQIAKILLGLQDPIIKVGNLEAVRPVVDVRDIVLAYYKLMLLSLKGYLEHIVYNVSGEIVYSIGSLLDLMLIMTELKNKVEIQQDPSLYRPIDIKIQKPNCDRLKSQINWSAKISIETTLWDLIFYFREKYGNI